MTLIISPCKKVENVQFLTEAIAIYFNKKPEFDSKNNHGGSKLAHF